MQVLPTVQALKNWFSVSELPGLVGEFSEL